jgi:hypothetical protein
MHLALAYKPPTLIDGSTTSSTQGLVIIDLGPNSIKSVINCYSTQSSVLHIQRSCVDIRQGSVVAGEQNRYCLIDTVGSAEGEGIYGGIKGLVLRVI